MTTMTTASGELTAQAPLSEPAAEAWLPLHGALTIEPGGQVELSSRTGSDLPAVLAEVSADLRLLRRRAAALGWRLTGIGLDPVSTPSRILDLPRTHG